MASAWRAARLTCSARSAAVQPRSSDEGRPAHRPARAAPASVGQDLGLAAAVVAQFVGMVGDAHEARRLEHRGRAVGHLVVELAAHHQHQVGLLHGARAHRAHHRGVAGVDQAAALLRVQVDGAAGVQQPVQRRAGAARAPRPVTTSGRSPRPAARRHVPPARRRGAARGAARRPGARPARTAGCTLSAARRWGISMYTGPGEPPSPCGHGPGLVEVGVRSARPRRAACARGARHRRQEGHVVDALQRAQVVLRSRRAAADQQHRHAFEVRVAHRGDAVGDAGAGGHGHAHAGPPSCACACAMCTAAPSSRTSTIFTPRRASQSQMGWMWPPCRP